MRVPVAAKPAKKTKQSKLDGVADRFASFRPASEVLTKVLAVPTIFPQIDHALRVGGWPVQRTALIHGPSNEGKSTLMLGLIASFVRRGHRALYLDAERTTPIDYVESLLGRDVLEAKAKDGSPLFYAHKPDHYEDAISKVRTFCNAMIAERRTDPDACAFIGLDSLTKLMPKGSVDEYFAELEAMVNAEKKGKQAEVKVAQDRLAQTCARANKRWMNEACPLVDKANVSFTMIVREIQKADAQKWEKDIGWDFILAGGRDPFFESSVVSRIERKWVYEGKGEDRTVIGEKHRVVTWKTKVAGKDDKKVVSFFHTSNGNLVAPGFDRARDVFELAERFDVIKSSGNHRVFGKKRIANGENATIKRMSEDLVLLAEVEAATRAKFMDVEPVHADAEGVVE